MFIIMNDIDKNYLKQAHNKINHFYKKKFNQSIDYKLNFSNFDFTNKIDKNDLFENNHKFKIHLNTFDIVFGNPKLSINLRCENQYKLIYTTRGHQLTLS